jgi:hypothetical protein
MKPLIWDSPEGYLHKYWMDYNWRPMEERTSTVIFMQGKLLPCEDIGGVKCSLDPKKYDLVFASEVKPEVFTKFDCLPNNATGMPPLVNQKVLDILNKFCPDDIQAFPATIIPELGAKHGFENHDYWVINIAKLVDAINLDRSEVEFFDPDPRIEDAIRTIKKLAFIDSEKFTKPLIARMSKAPLKIISPSLAQAFKDANVTGVEFIEDKDYRR